MTFFALFILFFFNDTATTEIYTLSLHDALPISGVPSSNSPVLENVALSAPMKPASKSGFWLTSTGTAPARTPLGSTVEDRKSTRLNSSHANISYAVFCLKKKKNQMSKTSRPYDI